MCRILDWNTGRLVRAHSPCGQEQNSPGAPTAPRSRLAATIKKSTSGMRRRSIRGEVSKAITTDGLSAAPSTLPAHCWRVMGMTKCCSSGTRLLGRPVLDMAGDGIVQVSEDGQIVVERDDQMPTYQVDPALEYRTFAFASREPDPGTSGHRCRRDGRLLAVGTIRAR